MTKWVEVYCINLGKTLQYMKVFSSNCRLMKMMDNYPEAVFLDLGANLGECCGNNKDISVDYVSCLKECTLWWWQQCLDMWSLLILFSQILLSFTKACRRTTTHIWCHWSGTQSGVVNNQDNCMSFLIFSNSRTTYFPITHNSKNQGGTNLVASSIWLQQQGNWLLETLLRASRYKNLLSSLTIRNGWNLSTGYWSNCAT